MNEFKPTWRQYHERGSHMIKLCKIRLDLFDGTGAAGAAGSAGDGSGTTGEGTSAAAAQEQDLSKVIYGREPESAEKQPTAEPEPAEPKEEPQKSLEERNKEYDEFIKANKDIHDKRTQELFNRRFADHKQLENTLKSQQEVITLLQGKYKTADGDIKGLIDAINADDSMWSDAAFEAGMTVDQYKEFQRLNRQNAELIQAERTRAAQAKAAQQVQAWEAEAADLNAKYPNFDLSTEMADPNFGRLLQSGVPMEQAYKVLHFDEIQNSVAANVAATTEKKVADSVRAKGSRPVENGTTSQSGFVYKSDPSKWTKADRAEIARRVARGEKITL